MVLSREMMGLVGAQKLNRAFERLDARRDSLCGGNQFGRLMSPFLQDADEIFQNLARAGSVDEPSSPLFRDRAEIGRGISNRSQVAVVLAPLGGLSGRSRGREQPRRGLDPK